MRPNVSCLSAAFLAIGLLAAVSCKKSSCPEDPGTVLVPANCHVISAPGTYSFKAFKGVSSENVGAVASAEVLWESFGTDETPSKGSIVAKVDYLEKDGLVRIKTPSSLKDGNALIAVKDASGRILWSWHIWVCNGWDPVKTAHTYYNNAGVMMDRNLGATSTKAGDVKALGLLYQWGRKDPFLGSSSITEKVLAASTLDWPEPVASSAQTGTIAYAVENPTTFITGGEVNYDWFYSGEYDTDNTRWQAGKTIYDPCPAGWVLPTGPSSPSDMGFWYKVYGKYVMSLDFDHENRGKNFTGTFGDADPIWYPLSGFRADDDAQIWAVGNKSLYWTSTPDLDEGDPDAKVMALALSIEVPAGSNDLLVFTAEDCIRSVGFSVRCVRE